MSDLESTQDHSAEARRDQIPPGFEEKTPQSQLSSCGEHVF